MNAPNFSQFGAQVPPQAAPQFSAPAPGQYAPPVPQTPGGFATGGVPPQGFGAPQAAPAPAPGPFPAQPQYAPQPAPVQQQAPYGYAPQPQAAPPAAYGAGMFAGATLMGNVIDLAEGVSRSVIEKIEQMPPSGKGGPYIRVTLKVTQVLSGAAQQGQTWHAAKNIGHPGTVEAKYLGSFMLGLAMAATGFQDERAFKAALAQAYPQSDDPFRDFGAACLGPQNPLAGREILTESTRRLGKAKEGQPAKMHASYRFAPVPAT